MKEGIIMPNYAKDGEVMYHTGLTKEMIKGAKYALVPGDPGRVEGLAKALDPNAAFVASHRGFTTWTAEVNGQPILVMSTGMGGPCVTFAVEELARLGVKTFIRVGTTGSMQEDLNLGDIVINKAAVRMDGASKAYAPIEYPAAADMRVTLALEEAARTLKIPFKTGISVSTDSFWPGQERYDSYAGYVRRAYQGSLEEYQHLGCTNFEMENATLFTLCDVMGLHAGSVCGVVAKRTDSETVAPHDVYEEAEKRFQKTVKLALKMLTGHFLVRI